MLLLAVAGAWEPAAPLDPFKVAWTGDPDASPYTFQQTAALQTTYGVNGTVVPVGDDGAAGFPLSPGFLFDGAVRTTLQVCANGALGFGGGGVCSSQPALLPDGHAGDPHHIAVLWVDLLPLVAGGGGDLRFWEDATSVTVYW
ncbi:MAG: hypothetical protein KC656_35310, partial [Myxococcales bacterium]|nr:hypothetical protein [Myxococcales bacterium]